VAGRCWRAGTLGVGTWRTRAVLRATALVHRRVRYGQISCRFPETSRSASSTGFRISGEAFIDAAGRLKPHQEHVASRRSVAACAAGDQLRLLQSPPLSLHGAEHLLDEHALQAQLSACALSSAEQPPGPALPNG
jgi:hypothetical protein